MHDDIDDTQFVHLPGRIAAQLDQELDEIEELMEMLQEMAAGEEEE
jgi:hypothetical protein